jgi:hypothetical protein
VADATGTFVAAAVEEGGLPPASGLTVFVTPPAGRRVGEAQGALAALVLAGTAVAWHAPAAVAAGAAGRVEVLCGVALASERVTAAAGVTLGAAAVGLLPVARDPGLLLAADVAVRQSPPSLAKAASCDRTWAMLMQTIPQSTA